MAKPVFKYCVSTNRLDTSRKQSFSQGDLLKLGELPGSLMATEPFPLSELQYYQLYERMMDGLVFMQMDGKLLQFNETFRQMLGYGFDELQRFTNKDVTPEKWHSLEVSLITTQLLPHGNSTIYEKEFRRKNGEIFPVEVRLILLKDIHDNPMGIWAIVRDITERKITEKALTAYQKRLQSLASELVKTEDRERRQIARYLHDQVGQSLAAIRVKYAAWRAMKVSPKRDETLNEIEELLNRAIEDTRSLTFELSPPILYELGLGPALEWIGEHFCEQHGLYFSFVDDGHAQQINDILSSALYRIVRELVLNCIKHAKAHKIFLSLSADSETIQVTVEDDGIGMEPARCEDALRGTCGTYGLFSVRERLHDFNGILVINTHPGHGMKVELSVPTPSRGVETLGDSP